MTVSMARQADRQIPLKCVFVFLNFLSWCKTVYSSSAGYFLHLLALGLISILFAETLNCSIILCAFFVKRRVLNTVGF